MKKIGTVSYNIYCNFTNYGSALQTWALHQAIKKIDSGNYKPVLVDYCPDVLMDKDPLNPFENMWDKDEESQRMCRLTLSAIRENFFKFDIFYHDRFDRTAKKYTSENFNDIIKDEELDGFICGSDTIFCTDEFGFDDGYYAEFNCMKNHSAAYAASFGDAHFDEYSYSILNDRLHNFKAIGLRENLVLSYVEQNTDVPVKRVLDPTLLLTSDDYDKIAAKPLVNEKYILLYARRYDPKMEAYAERLAAEHNMKIIEISLRAENAEKPNRRMFYEAGVEEFLSLIKYAGFVVTNSFHGMIFSIQYKRPFTVFSREQCNNKITELLEMLGLSERMHTTENDKFVLKFDYNKAFEIIETERKKSFDFLRSELEMF